MAAKSKIPLTSAWRAAAVATVILVECVQPCVAEIVRSDDPGLALDKPDTWRNQSESAFRQLMAKFSDHNQQVAEAFKKGLVIPAIFITKHDEPYSGLNPSISVGVRRRPDPYTTALDALARKIDRSHAVFQGVVVEQEPIEASIGGRTGAYARVAYRMRTPEGDLPVLSQQWIVMRGDKMVLISAGSPLDDTEGARNEIRAILDTLKFEGAD